ncbi:hypothetical protein FGO68_gene10289 [Halteria grandinella]|uniref:Uncharacterized protein n=1 Tax=Halteria grandinella TaxID=5974 RepID=A0A8J8N9U9_HALGN|nr:hypothetical protein FGO68_gene10289 [Halteria grandinella]
MIFPCHLFAHLPVQFDQQDPNLRMHPSYMRAHAYTTLRISLMYAYNTRVHALPALYSNRIQIPSSRAMPSYLVYSMQSMVLDVCSSVWQRSQRAARKSPSPLDQQLAFPWTCSSESAHRRQCKPSRGPCGCCQRGTGTDRGYRAYHRLRGQGVHWMAQRTTYAAIFQSNKLDQMDYLSTCWNLQARVLWEGFKIL